MSNSETVHLEWNVTLPGIMPVTIRYDNTSNLNNINFFSIGVDTILTLYKSDEYIESIIIFTVVKNVSLNNSIIQCNIGDLDRNSANVFINTSGILYTIIFVYYYYYHSLFTVNSSPHTNWIHHRKRILYGDGQHCYV